MIGAYASCSFRLVIGLRTSLTWHLPHSAPVGWEDVASVNEMREPPLDRAIPLRYRFPINDLGDGVEVNVGHGLEIVFDVDLCFVWLEQIQAASDLN